MRRTLALAAALVAAGCAAAPASGRADVEARVEVDERPGGILVLTAPRRVTLHGRGLDVRAVVLALVGVMGENAILSPAFGGRIDLALEDACALQALYFVV